jgi:hypothetical protein
MAIGSNSLLVRGLRDRSNAFYRISQAARSWISNRQWHSTYKGGTLVVLDFDVICGALSTGTSKPMLLGDQIDSARLFSPIVGRRLLKHLLSSTPRFGLPPGTIFELLEWKERAQGKLAEQSKHMLDRYRSIRTNKNPGQALAALAEGRKASRVLEAELESFISSANDLQLLSDILDQRQDVEQYLDAPPADLEQTFSTAFRALAQKRPEHDSGNFQDAINVSFLSWMFKSVGGISPEKEYPMPLLVTTTQPLIRLSDAQPQLGLPDWSEIALIASEYYLWLDVGLAHLSSGIDKIAIRRTRLIQETALTLERRYNELAKRIQDEELDREEVINSFDWQRIMIAEKQFDEKWRLFGDPSGRLKRLDAQDDFWASETNLRHALRKIDSPDSQKVRVALESIYDSCRARCMELGIVESLAIQTAMQAEKFSFEALSAIFSFRRIDLLTKQVSELDNTSFDVPDMTPFALTARHWVRIIAAPRLAVIDGPLITLESRCRGEPKSRNWISVAWQIDESTATLFLAIRRLFAEARPGFMESEATLFVAGERVDGSDIGRTLESVLESVGSESEPDFFALRCGDLVVEADVGAIDRNERHIAVIFPQPQAEDPLPAAIAKCFVQTRAIPVPADVIRRLINNLIQIVFLQNTPT